MADPSLPPNPCLLGILLVTRFDSDPKVVFHYPPRPGEDDPSLSKYFTRSVDDGITSSSEEENSSTSEDEDQPISPDTKPKVNDKPQDPDVDDTGSASPEKHDGMTTPERHFRWDDLFGYSSDQLAKLLCPAHSSHKKKFEVALNDIVFLGRPIYARKDGQWRRSKHRPMSYKATIDQNQDGTDDKTTLPAIEDFSETSGAETEADRPTKVFANATSQTPNDIIEKPEAVLHEGNEHLPSETKDELTMFHVLFILDPPPLEYHLRIKEMYDNVVKKLSRAMKWEQVRSSYVSKESIAIARLTKKYFKSSKSSGKLGIPRGDIIITELDRSGSSFSTPLS